ncbi:hypothetical protein BDB00DRAFT_839534 [Zychaea mexicana]|uniref:uncharacterized protein n=1 Tax=Zychaea mexicana TaxID=64656 RepID=UPI0022FEAFD9|nr:uncharacterized protein BDB00DRAFT_839534 [Zychaea mexicana]KAI9490085.1 hypothetical protein BDB00DRAFT_839534 [Zychaea mexicana]
MAANAQEFNIEMAAVPREHVKDVLRALLHSIFFHRLLVHVTPREFVVLDTTVSATDNRDVEHLIDERAAEFVQNICSSHVKQGKIAVLFYEQRDKKIWFQLSKTKELVCWERWAITMSLAQPANDQDRQKIQRSLEKQLSKSLHDILRLANDHKEHIPSIKTIDGNPFPYHIAILSQSESWGAMIKRLLVTDAPAASGTESDTSATPSPSSSSSIRRGSLGVGGGSSSAGLARPAPTSSTSSSSSTTAAANILSRSPRRSDLS